MLVYFATWLAPEPFFSKAFAAVLTVRLSLLVGLVELGRVAMACLHLYQEVEAATTPQEMEAASERFGKSIGGTALRVLVVVASLGMPQVLPKVSKGGLETLLSPLRHALAGGPALESIATAQIVANGTVVVTGVAAGTSAASLCGELATCTMMNGAGGASGGGPRLSTRYGKPHTRQNPPHNEAIEQELARREAAGHTDLRKNKPQQNASKIDVYDRRPTKGIGFRKPDASSIRPDGIRHNTNYVSNSQDYSASWMPLIQWFGRIKRLFMSCTVLMAPWSDGMCLRASASHEWPGRKWIIRRTRYSYRTHWSTRARGERRTGRVS